MVSTDELNIECFLEGLYPELNQDVRMAKTQATNLSVIADRELIAEQVELKIVKAHEARNVN